MEKQLRKADAFGCLKVLDLHAFLHCLEDRGMLKTSF